MTGSVALDVNKRDHGISLYRHLGSAIYNKSVRTVNSLGCCFDFILKGRIGQKRGAFVLMIDGWLRCVYKTDWSVYYVFKPPLPRMAVAPDEKLWEQTIPVAP